MDELLNKVLSHLQKRTLLSGGQTCSSWPIDQLNYLGQSPCSTPPPIDSTCEQCVPRIKRGRNVNAAECLTYR